jgi:hypothetical protein
MICMPTGGPASVHRQGIEMLGRPTSDTKKVMVRYSIGLDNGRPSISAICVRVVANGITEALGVNRKSVEKSEERRIRPAALLLRGKEGVGRHLMPTINVPEEGFGQNSSLPPGKPCKLPMDDRSAERCKSLGCVRTIRRRLLDPSIERFNRCYCSAEYRTHGFGDRCNAKISTKGEPRYGRNIAQRNKSGAVKGMGQRIARLEADHRGKHQRSIVDGSCQDSMSYQRVPCRRLIRGRNETGRRT